MREPILVHWLFKTSRAKGHEESLFLYGEVVLAYAADGAYPVFGDVFKGSAGGDAAVGVAYFGVINVTTGVANVLFHNRHVLKVKYDIVILLRCVPLSR